MRFRDRRDAGRKLVDRLQDFASKDVVVLGLPRGGVPVAHEVATALGASFDIVLVRKLGVPWQPELAMGAIGEGDIRVLNDDVISSCGITTTHIESAERKERIELQRRIDMYRPAHPRQSLTGKMVVIVDDGIATGSTARAACRVARARGATWIVLSTPVAPLGWEEMMGDVADEYIALHTPESFRAVGDHYENFEQVNDDEVLRLLQQKPSARHQRISRDVSVRLSEDVTLQGHLSIPINPRGCVVFVHGSGSSRMSPRNQHVAQILDKESIATFLFDLLTEEESERRDNVFDIELLSKRLQEVTRWLRRKPDISELSIGYFGASTGAAAALSAAADDKDIVAVVSRGGRPDLATDDLPRVQCPVLLIVGSRDVDVRFLNEEAAALMTCEHSVAIVQHASHLFEEPGTLEEAANLARDFFVEHFSQATVQPGQVLAQSTRASISDSV